MRISYFTAVTLTAFAMTLGAASAKPTVKHEPYPTQTKVQYVLQCMEVNGKTPEMLQKCSCGIDTIESELPFDTYEMADTGLQLANAPGARAAQLRSVNTVKDAVQALRRAQADSNLKCF